MVAATLFAYPELLGLVLAALFLLGRYTGYRLTELYRFQDVIRPEPVQSTKAEEKQEETLEVMKPGEMAPAV